MKRAELITALKKAKAKKQVVGLKFADNTTHVGRINRFCGDDIDGSDSIVCCGNNDGCFITAITQFWTYKPSSRRQVRQVSE